MHQPSPFPGLAQPQLFPRVGSSRLVSGTVLTWLVGSSLSWLAPGIISSLLHPRVGFFRADSVRRGELLCDRSSPHPGVTGGIKKLGYGCLVLISGPFQASSESEGLDRLMARPTSIWQMNIRRGLSYLCPMFWTNCLIFIGGTPVAFCPSSRSMSSPLHSTGRRFSL